LFFSLIGWLFFFNTPNVHHILVDILLLIAILHFCWPIDCGSTRKRFVLDKPSQYSNSCLMHVHVDTWNLPSLLPLIRKKKI
jgi:hypothetical protein